MLLPDAISQNLTACETGKRMFQSNHCQASAAFSVQIVVAYTLFLLVVVIAAACDTNESIQPIHRFPSSGVVYPAGYRETFIHYATIERKDGTIRDVYLSRNALNGNRIRQPLPLNTTIVIEGFYAQKNESGSFLYTEDQRFIKGAPFEMVHVIEKRSDWQSADFPSAARSGQWNFGSFNYATGKKFDEDLTACFNCHNTMTFDDFLYTTPQLTAFEPGGLPEYFFCNLAARIPC